mgnify:CR=1 FL=1
MIFLVLLSLLLATHASPEEETVSKKSEVPPGVALLLVFALFLFAFLFLLVCAVNPKLVCLLILIFLLPTKLMLVGCLFGFCSL